jgi:glutamate-1-semialdehyde 2,1-aminomutase
MAMRVSIGGSPFTFSGDILINRLFAASEMTIEDDYRSRTPGSARLHEQARRVLPAGLTHDSRTTSPYAVYVARALGPRKWDVDGNEYIDYFGGHGALLYGHCHRPVVEAVQRQAALGTHWGASHELEVRWAELVQRLIPSAERVRFTASGTEASQLAMRLARAYTAKPKIVRFVGHFHGWHDQVAAGGMSHFDGSAPPGIPDSIVRESQAWPSTRSPRAPILPRSSSSLRARRGARCRCRPGFCRRCARPRSATGSC